MSLVDKFLASVTDENGNKIDFSNVESEGFIGVVYFGETSCFLNVNSYTLEIQELGDILNSSEYEMCYYFGKYVQQKMKEHKAFLQDDINTKNDLYNYGKF